MFGAWAMAGNYESRKIANDEDVDGGIVDTARVTDSAKPFETGICHPAYNDDNWIVVELYDTKEEAIEGHKKWVDYLMTKPLYLKDVNECELNEIGKAVGACLNKTYYRVEPSLE